MAEVNEERVIRTGDPLILRVKEVRWLGEGFSRIAMIFVSGQDGDGGVLRFQENELYAVPSIKGWTTSVPKEEHFLYQD